MQTPRRHEVPGDQPAVILQFSQRNDGATVIDATLRTVGREIPLFVLCTVCGQPSGARMRVAKTRIPERMDVQTTCPFCGGTAVLPDYYTVFDARDGSMLPVFRPRPVVTVSAITAAELSRLAAAVRAAQRHEPGADELLYKMLDSSAPPIRALKEKWTRDQKLMVITILVGLVAALGPLLANEGGVSEERLVSIIEHLVEDQSDSAREHNHAEGATARRTGRAGAYESGATPDSLDGQGGWPSKDPDDHRDVAQGRDE